jgi:hypothetical protein
MLPGERHAAQITQRLRVGVRRRGGRKLAARLAPAYDRAHECPLRLGKEDSGNTTTERGKTMGDPSPKSAQKMAKQKQSRTDDANQKKQAIITAQQVSKAKQSAGKKG